MLRLTIIGNLGQDATSKEVKETNVINFSVAVKQKVKNTAGGYDETTVWTQCEYFTTKTGVLEYLKKGTKVYVEGWPQSYGYIDKENKIVSGIKLRIDNLELLTGKKDDQ